MDDEALFGKYWRLFKDDRFTKEFLREMKNDGWTGLVQYVQWDQLKEARENYRKKVEKAERDAYVAKLEKGNIAL